MKVYVCISPLTNKAKKKKCTCKFFRCKFTEEEINNPNFIPLGTTIKNGSIYIRQKNPKEQII